ncbi:MAG: 16S rRNA (uracil(1498)-N(3))-methyltransferase [Propionibacteriaceae bacterium]|nr:16S rRNA (uracil(1498)-N(3))-methyltransferase [Propionibacteriaceae bacterium]
MSDALFLAAFGVVKQGDVVAVTGSEARHAVAVKRITVGERILVADGQGRAVRGHVVTAAKDRLAMEVTELLEAPARAHRFVVVQALVKGDRSERAVEVMTELGVDEILAWQATRSIVRWHGERAAKSLAKWGVTAREAAKQSRRYRVPEVRVADTRDVVGRIRAANCALILHESAEKWLGQVDLPEHGEVLLIVGPEGGITPEELRQFQDAGAVPVLISDAVLRASTAGAVALGQLSVLL